MICLLKI